MKKLCCALRVLVAHAINFSFSVKKVGSEKHSLLMTSITKYNQSLIPSIFFYIEYYISYYNKCHTWASDKQKGCSIKKEGSHKVAINLHLHSLHNHNAHTQQPSLPSNAWEPCTHKLCQSCDPWAGCSVDSTVVHILAVIQTKKLNINRFSNIHGSKKPYFMHYTFKIANPKAK
jgi:hypothetical protein